MCESKGVYSIPKDVGMRLKVVDVVILSFPFAYTDHTFFSKMGSKILQVRARRLLGVLATLTDHFFQFHLPLLFEGLPM